MENWISLIISRVKTLSFAARFVPNKEYKNLPIEELTEQSYLLRKAAIKWESFATLDADSSGEKYCNSEKCAISE